MVMSYVDLTASGPHATGVLENAKYRPSSEGS